MTNKQIGSSSASEPCSPELNIFDNVLALLLNKTKLRNNSACRNPRNTSINLRNNYHIESKKEAKAMYHFNTNSRNRFPSNQKKILFSDNVQINNFIPNHLEMMNNSEQQDTLIQKEINNLRLSKFEKKQPNAPEFNHQTVPHPSLPLKTKRCLSGDIVNYKSLMQVLDDEYRLELQKEQIPTIMIAQGITPTTDGRRKSQLISFPRKAKKDNNTLAQKFLIMRQQRKKKKQTKKLRRKSCTCHECGGAATSYQLKYNDTDIDTAMARKVKLANIVIENLRSQTSENKSLKLKKEKQMNALKAALEKTFFEQFEKEGQSEQKQGDQQSYQQEQVKFDRGLTRIKTNMRVTYSGDMSPDKNTPASKMTEQDYRERLTQTDLDNYKFNRNKSNYSRPQENIKKMRQTMIQYNIIESLNNINEDQNSFQNRTQRLSHKNLTQSLKNLAIPERQSPEKKSYPYKLQQRSTQNTQFKQLPPKIVLRKDLQNLFFKQSAVFEKILDDLEQTIPDDSQKTQRSTQHMPLIKPIQGSSIDLSGNTHQFFQSVIQQRWNKSNNYQQTETSLKTPLTTGSKYNITLSTPIKQKQSDRIFFHNSNGQEQHNLFFNKDLSTTKSQHLNPYTRTKMTPLRSRSPHLLPQIEVMSSSCRK